MTAQEIIEKIRAEIERQKADWIETMKKHGEDGYIPSFIESLDRILSTLQEQPVCEGLEEEIRSYLMTNRIVNHSEMGWKRWGEQIARHFAQWGAEHRGSSEKPNDLVSELKHHLATTPKEQLQKEWDELKKWDNIGPTVQEFLRGSSEKPNIALQGDMAAPIPPTMKNPEDRIRFMEYWQKNHSKVEKSEIPNDLEEAARHSEILTYPMPEDGDMEKVFKVQEARIFHEIGFITGAKWQEEQDLKFISEIHRNGYNLCKEQLMKDAVEGWVARDGFDNTLCFFSNKPHRPDIQEPLKVWKMWLGGCFHLPKQLFPDLKWEDEPKNVKLIIIKEDKK